MAGDLFEDDPGPEDTISIIRPSRRLLDLRRRTRGQDERLLQIALLLSLLCPYRKRQRPFEPAE